MLRGYRLLVAALGLILAANHSYAKSTDQQPNAQQPIADSLSDIAETTRQQAERSERSDKDEAPCGERQYGSSADLCAQWKAADAAANSAWWAWVAGLSTIISTAAVIVAIGLTYQANSIARDTARRQLRAYITVSKVRLLDSGRILIRARNFGATPASGVKIRWSMTIEGPADGPDPDFTHDPWSFSEAYVASSRSTGFRFNSPEMVELVKKTHDLGGVFYIFGSIRYCDIFGKFYIHDFKLMAKKLTWESNPGRFEVCADGNSEQTLRQPSLWSRVIGPHTANDDDSH